MNFCFSYLIFFLFFTANLFCQDVLVKKDSSRIEVKLLEVRQNELKYKLFNYQEGPDIIISKSEIAYAVYSNGIKEIFKSTESEIATNVVTNPTPPKGSVRRPDSIGNYIKFNVQLGAVVQSLSSNYTRREPPASHTSSEEYSASSNKSVYNYNLGFNFLFGKSPYVKHIIGINYLRSTGEYDYSYSQGGYTSYYQDFHYVSKIDFINVVTGLRFKLFKKLYIEPLISFNIVVNSDVRRSGTSTTKYISGNATVYKTETEYYSNQKVSAERSGINSTVSLCPKISYDFGLKKQTLGVYISYNLAYEFRLPWMMAGITYYPFKKLNAIIDIKKVNQSTDKKKRKLFNGMKLNIDGGALFNNGFTHTEENYSGVKTLNAAQYKTGHSLGLNFLHGGSNYFKHITTVSFTESYAELHQRHYYYTDDKPAGYKYEYIYSTVYNSTLRFLNIGTGLRFTVLEHLNFDNGIAFNTPIYSRNKIVATRETNKSSYSGSSTSSTYEILENKTSSDFLIRKKNWSFFAKMSYEFTIKQKRLGIFATWNYKLKNSAQWFVAGLTYYPFKKLR